MVDAGRLLAELKKLRKKLEADLRQPSRGFRCARGHRGRMARGASRRSAPPTLSTPSSARRSTRRRCTGFSRSSSSASWRTTGCIDRPLIAGPGERLELAQLRQREWFRTRPEDSDAEYLLAMFAEVARLPGLAGLFDPTHNPLFRLARLGRRRDRAVRLLSPALAGDRRVAPRLHRPGLEHALPRRPLPGPVGGGAQALRAAADAGVRGGAGSSSRTLDPAIREFGHDASADDRPDLRLGPLSARRLRPTAGGMAATCAGDAAGGAGAAGAGCGRGRGPQSFRRRDRAVPAAARGAAGCRRDAPRRRAGFPLPARHRATACCTGGTSRGTSSAGRTKAFGASCGTTTRPRTLRRSTPSLGANTTPSSATRPTSRRRMRRCGTPTGRSTKAAIGSTASARRSPSASSTWRSSGHAGSGRGFVGLIVANSFMKREFGKKLIEEVLPRLDLTHVVDCSGAYIPGHGTPTVILFGRNRAPVGRVFARSWAFAASRLRRTQRKGLVWSAIVAQTDLGRLGERVRQHGGYAARDSCAASVEYGRRWGATCKKRLRRIDQVLGDIGSRDRRSTSITGEDDVSSCDQVASLRQSH